MKQYLQLLQNILDNGTYKAPARENMPGTTSLFGYQMRFNLQEGFPLLTTKKMYWKGIVIELLWFLRGDINIKFLDNNDVKIWHQDAYNYYCKIAKANGGLGEHVILQPVSNKLNTRTPMPKDIDSYSMFTFEEFCDEIKKTENLPIIGGYRLGDCGYQYGKVWRDWDKFEYNPERNLNSMHWEQQKGIDQIANVIKSLKESPEGRRHIVTAWDPSHDQDLALTWCHAMFQFNCRALTLDQRISYLFGKPMEGIGENTEQKHKILDHKGVPRFYLDCQLYQRSADVVLGVPFNIASYALLTEIIAKICNMVPGDFVHTFGDVHIYDNHMDAVKEQLQRTPKEIGKLSINCDFATFDEFIDKITWTDFRLIGYDPHPKLESETELSTGMKK